jgi:hypothetical protein
VDEGFDFVAGEEDGFGSGKLDARVEFACGERACGSAQLHDRTHDEQNEDEGGKAGDDDGDGKLRRREVQQVVEERGLPRNMGPAEEEDVGVAAVCSRGDRPDVLVADLETRDVTGQAIGLGRLPGL